MHYDIHLSAGSISTETIERIEAFGMIKDGLRNNRNSVEPHHHASTPHLNEPDIELWEEIKRTLAIDTNFRGALEFEFNDPTFRRYFNTSDSVSLQQPIVPFRLEQCRPGEHKACDVHIRVDPLRTAPEAFEELDKYNFIYFERLVKGLWQPVYTLTFEDVSIGKMVMNRLLKVFGNIPNLVGKIKLESIHNYWVYPDSAHQLPLVRTKDAEKWLRQMG